MLHEVGRNRALAAVVEDYLNFFASSCLHQQADFDKCMQYRRKAFLINLPNDRLLHFDECLEAVAVIKADSDSDNGSLEYIRVQSMQFGSYDVVPSMFIETDLVKGSLTARLAASAICDSLL